MRKKGKVEKFVRRDEFILSNGQRATVTVIDDEYTVTDPEGVAQCIEDMKRTAANIFARRAMREQQDDPEADGA